MGALDFSILWDQVVWPVVRPIGTLALSLVVIFLALLTYAQMKYRFPMPWSLGPMAVRRLKRMQIRFPILSFLRWMVLDFRYSRKRRDEFSEYGLTLYCGRQGSGKTVSMTNYANKIRHRYPQCIIVTNFKYRYADKKMESWRDFVDIRNGKNGVLFLIDEIHSEFSSASWKDFPENLLSEVSQQRKQRIKIVATSQIFTRVVKQLREQADTVVQCTTIGNRWTFNKEYDAKDYELACDSAEQRKKLHPFRRGSFVQSDDLRRCYDTYEKIERLAKMEFIPRHERRAE